MNQNNQKTLLKMSQILKNWNKLSKNRTWLRTRIRETVKHGFTDLTVTERNKISRVALEIAYSGSDVMKLDSYHELIKTINKFERRSDSRMKQEAIREMIGTTRGTDTGYPTVFYACDEHSNPAADHAPYQGKIYIDRYWESKFSWPDWMERSIRRYIRGHGTVSIQKITGAPVYLGTRPYCKHKFYPLDTMSVLTRDPATLIPKVRIRRKLKRTKARI